MQLLIQIGVVAFGSALGGLLRWGVAVAFARMFGTGFPWGTFFINLSGCLFLGWFMTTLKEHLISDNAWISSTNLNLMIAVGFTGAYTTFSTYEFETHTRLAAGEHLKALTYLFGSMFLGLIAVHLGVVLARGKWDLS